MTNTTEALAREAGIEYDRNDLEELARFEALVRADEREMCAKLADEYATHGGSNFEQQFLKLAAAIRGA